MIQARRAARVSPYFALISLLALTGWVYWDGLKGGFTFDDFPNIVQNLAIADAKFTFSSLLRAAFSSHAGPLRRPLASLSFALQIASTGLSPFALKLGNLLIHLLNATLVFFVVQKMVAAPGVRATCRETCSTWLPVVVAGAWALAPINLTGVLYIVQRMESLSTLFMLLGLLFYLEGRHRLLRDEANALLLCVGGLLVSCLLAVLAKETGVMLMAYAFVVEWTLFGFRTASGEFDRRIIKAFTILCLLPGIVGLAITLPAALSGQAYANRTFDLAQRLLTQGRAMVDYLRWIVAPSLGQLSLYHDDFPVSRGWLSPASTLAAWIFLASLLGLALWLRKRRPLIALGVLFFFAGHALISTYLPLEMVYEYRNYLPSMGIFLSLFALLLGERQLENLPLVRMGLVLAALVFYGFSTYLRAHEWADPLRLAYFESSHHPDSLRAAYDLGSTLALIAPSTRSPLFLDARNTFERAERMPGAGLLPSSALIVLMSKNGLPVQPSWWSQLRRDARTTPISSQDVGALYALIQCSRKGVCKYDTRELGRVLMLAVAYNPDRADLVTLDANYQVNLAHDYGAGLASMQRAVAIRPRDTAYWWNLVSLQIALGQFTEARVGIERLRELNRLGFETRAIQALTAELTKQASTGAAGVRHAS